MKALIVVNREEEWPHAIPGAEVASARSYLTEDAASGEAYRLVVNLCRCARAEDEGFYVSLLAEARGHHPLPSAKALQELNTPANALALQEVEKLLAPGAADVEVDAYFGADPTGGHAALARQLFTLTKTPLLRATFRQSRLRNIEALAPDDIPAEHREALVRAATRYITGQARPASQNGSRPSIAILYNRDAPLPPSNPAALAGFVRAAEALGMRAEIIDRDACDRLPEFNALFIRDTTFLEHYTYRFAQRAMALGLVVMDDPDSILQCNNKVYLNELLTRHQVPVPRSLMVHRDNIADISPALGMPCVLKEPGGGFSIGVHKAEREEELAPLVRRLLQKSELIIAQEYLPTEYDWRVTVIDRRVLFVCKYFMAPGHWQVHNYEPDGHSEGKTVALSIGEAPRIVVDTALRAANLMGDGFYGVDLKITGERCYVIEINDNPSVDAGCEDQVLKAALYRDVMGVFLRRIRERALAVAA
jgi:glutathione synthase/RimK-type ligase-like ATP-grasp enzyme